ncbi:hypothetical protein Q4R69_06105 [Morganella morganii subsp. sibonii]
MLNTDVVCKYLFAGNILQITNRGCQQSARQDTAIFVQQLVTDNRQVYTGLNNTRLCGYNLRDLNRPGVVIFIKFISAGAEEREEIMDEDL